MEIEVQINFIMDGWFGGWIDGWVGGWMDGCVGGRTDR